MFNLLSHRLIVGALIPCLIINALPMPCLPRVDISVKSHPFTSQALLMNSEALSDRALGIPDKALSHRTEWTFWKLLESFTSSPAAKMDFPDLNHTPPLDAEVLGQDQRASASLEARQKVFGSLEENFQKNGIFKWNVGDRTIRAKLMFDRKSDTIQVKLDNPEDWWSLYYRGDRQYKNDVDYPDRDSFGQLVVDAYILEDGSTALLIKQVQPGPLYYGVKKMRRSPYDFWSIGAVQHIRLLAHDHCLQIFASTPEAIKSRQGDLNDYEITKSYIDPFPETEWSQQIMDFPRSGLGSPSGRHFWYASRGNSTKLFSANHSTQAWGTLRESRINHVRLGQSG